MITTYSELKDEVILFLDNSSVSERAPTFIQLAESVIQREVRGFTEEDRAYITQYTQAGQDAYRLPRDFNGMRGCFIDGSPKTALQMIPLHRLRETWAGSTQGKPLVYAMTDEHIIFGPTPDSEYDVEIAYYAFNALSDENPTNSILDHYPDLYLSLSLMYAYRYMHDDNRELKMKNDAREIIERIRKKDSALKFGSTPLQIRAS